MMDLLLSIHMFMNGAWDSLLPLALVAVVTAIIIYTIVLMFGRAFSIHELETHAKAEMLQAVSTAFIAIFLVFIVGSAMAVAGQFIKGKVQCGGDSIQIKAGDGIMDDAYSAIRCRLQSKAQELADAQSKIHSDPGIAWKFNALNVKISIFGFPVWDGGWSSSLFKETESYRVVNNMATNMLISLNAQSQLIEYLRLNMLDIFIPMGILLRSFFFTRGPGALMISLGIGMYFIFPVFFVLLDPGFVPAPPDPPAPQQIMANPYCYATMSTSATIMKTVEAGGLGSSSGLSLSDIKNNLADYYVGLMLHPLIAFFLTLVFVRYMMTILGGDTYELTKMVSKVI
ncbi:hypothetical protein H0O00_03350 [Candidatus Micrarchaeota archaeon]|nr:hypothetical protein [Candidatus Micrarchaeota archaeon]